MLSLVEEGLQLVSLHAEGLRRRIEIQTVPRLILHLRHQDRLPVKRRGPADPIPLGLHPDDLRVSVLGDLADQGVSIGIRHPIGRLYLLLGGHDDIEALFGGHHRRIPQTNVRLGSATKSG